jgi:hypothetical protein
LPPLKVIYKVWKRVNTQGNKKYKNKENMTPPMEHNNCLLTYLKEKEIHKEFKKNYLN